MSANKADIFLLAGGHESSVRKGDPLLAGIFSLLGLERPALAYIGAASSDSRAFFTWSKAMLKKAGAGSIRLTALAAARADLAKARQLLCEADLIFISGGDVELGMKVLAQTGFSSFLRELNLAGKPFIGLSAGSIMLARSWARWPDAGNDATAEAFPCLGLAPLYCDTHAEKEDWAELKVLLKLTGASRGYGIPSGAALRVSADGYLQALGKPLAQITFMDGRIRRGADLNPA